MRLTTKNSYAKSIAIYSILAIGMVASYKYAVSLMTTPRTAWIEVVQSNVTVNLLIVFGLIGFLVDLLGKKKKWKTTKTVSVIVAIAFVIYIIMILFGGFTASWMK